MRLYRVTGHAAGSGKIEEEEVEASGETEAKRKAIAIMEARTGKNGFTTCSCREIQ